MVKSVGCREVWRERGVGRWWREGYREVVERVGCREVVERTGLGRVAVPALPGTSSAMTSLWSVGRGRPVLWVRDGISDADPGILQRSRSQALGALSYLIHSHVSGTWC